MSEQEWLRAVLASEVDAEIEWRDPVMMSAAERESRTTEVVAELERLGLLP